MSQESSRICYDSTAIAEQPYPEIHGRRDHRATILPCGHIFGDHCISQYLRGFEEDGRDPTCPACRTKLEHEKCVHACLGTAVPSCQTLICTVPPTLSEGGKITDSCCKCDLTEVVRFLLREALIEATLPVDHSICVSAGLSGDPVWFKPYDKGGDEEPDAQEVLDKSWELQQFIIMSERRLRKKHLHEWSTGDLTGLKLEVHVYKYEEQEED
ncbi:hypothetical protein CEP54_005078 [Fusarium duplospermum]|uniref:RING-type domain-containing protein n=1 Tax=Fusarium duplospermum TaxID=1325734 RepID=A0A428QER5_9HYPO|nr:hypothetical protein CEP54_005078 [Fusarium duplospermum]